MQILQNLSMKGVSRSSGVSTLLLPCPSDDSFASTCVRFTVLGLDNIFSVHVQNTFTLRAASQPFRVRKRSMRIQVGQVV